MDLIADFSKMSLQEKFDFLKEVFERQRQSKRMDVNFFFFFFFARNYSNQILNELCRQKAQNEVFLMVFVIVNYFKKR